MEKLLNTKWEIAAADDVKKTLDKIKQLIAKYKWENMKVYPYSYPINIVEFVNSFEDYDNFTFMSKQLALDEINGLIEHCVNPWLEYENKPKVKVKLKENGNLLKTTQELADDLIESGLAEII